LKRQAGPYLQLIHALENDTKTHLGMSTTSDGSQFMMDDEDDAAGFEGEAQISGG